MSVQCLNNFSAERIISCVEENRVLGCVQSYWNNNTNTGLWPLIKYISDISVANLHP